MNQSIEKLKSELSDTLFGLDHLELGLEKLNLTLKIIDVALDGLNDLIKNNPFATEQEEINVFKNAKPELLARRIEEVMRYNLVINLPIGTDESRVKYFEDELKARRSFFRMNNFHYLYFKNGFSDLDKLYFLRSAPQLILPVTEFSEPQSELITPMTYLFAKFIAYEHLQYFILEQIAKIKYPQNEQIRASEESSGLKWTGDNVNVVEIAYGIWLTGQLNYGNASLKQIVKWLETSLNITIGIVQRRFSEIEGRKRLSPTKFLDQMKDAILKKIDKGNS